MAPVLEVRHVTKAFGQGQARKVVLSDVSLHVDDTETLCVVGPSGAGKTTFLRCLAGLENVTEGEVLLNGERITEPPGSLAVVFQDYSRSLYPWMSVMANVELPLVAEKVPKAERRALTHRMLDAVGLGDATQQLPGQLSGGMQQRVAIARALAYRPKLLLMDEPFASLDAQTRADLEDLVVQLRQEFSITTIFVTHDIDEAVYLGDRVLVLGGSPTTVTEILEVPLGRHRDQIHTKSRTEFTELRSRILARIRDERDSKAGNPGAATSGAATRTDATSRE